MTNREEMEGYRFQVENHLPASTKEEKFILGGDHNTHVGAKTNIQGTSERSGMRTQ